MAGNPIREVAIERAVRPNGIIEAAYSVLSSGIADRKMKPCRRMIQIVP